MDVLRTCGLTFEIAAAVIHTIVFLIAIGYAQNYYYHLRMYSLLNLE